jgi:predicted RNA-binding protein with PUA-like domain
LLIVFGAEERGKVEAIRNGLSQHTQKEYDKATTYHDGKWFCLTIDNDKVVKDVISLQAVKRKPKNNKEA